MSRQVCPMCVRDDQIRSEVVAPGIRQFTCNGRKDHSDGQVYVWRSADEEWTKEWGEGGEGLMHDIGLLHDLLQCVHAGEGWVEYGIVEDRYRKLNADGFDQICERYGHHHAGEKRSGAFSASVYIAKALGMLKSTGELELLFGKATGEWAYNGEISYWAKPPRPPESKQTSCVTHAATSGGGPDAGDSTI